MYRSKQKRSLSFYVLLKICFALIMPVYIVIFSFHKAWPAPPSTMVYMKQNSGVIEAEIEPEEQNGVVNTSYRDLIIQIDDQTIEGKIERADNGALRVSGNFSGLEDGPHIVKMRANGDNFDAVPVHSSLFYIDTVAPIITMLEPKGMEINFDDNLFVLSCIEEGSGIQTLDGQGISVTIDGKKVNYALTQKNSETILTINSDFLSPGKSILLSVQIIDKAGNIAEFNKSFRIKNYEQDDVEFASAWCIDKSGRDGQVILISKIPYWPYYLSSEDQSIIFNNNKLTHTFIVDTQVTNKWSYGCLNEKMMDIIDLTSDNSAITIQQEKISFHQKKFTITQQKIVTNSDEELCFLKLKVTSAYEIPKSDICSLLGMFNNCSTGSIKLTERIIKIPVLLATSLEFATNITLDEQKLKYRVRFSSEAINLAESWFKAGNEKAWFKKSGNGVYEASCPVTEGKLKYKVVLGWLKPGTVLPAIPDTIITNNESNTTIDGDYKVKFAPPMIYNFRYDRNQGVFKGKISDKGTPLKDLKISLKASGREIPVDLDIKSGELMTPYSGSSQQEQAVLEVIDNADQTVRAIESVHGKPSENQAAGISEAGYPALYNVETHSSNNAGKIDRSRGYMHRNSVVSGNIVSIDKNGFQKVARYKKEWVSVSEGSRGCVQWVYEQVGIDYNSNNRMEEFYNLSADKRILVKRGGKECRKKFIHQHSYRDNQRIKASTEFVRAIRRTIHTMDVLGPVVQNIKYNIESGEVTAHISDHGSPVWKHNVYFSVSGKGFKYKRLKDFKFDSASGRFAGKCIVDQEYEIYTITISAKDSAGNWGSGKITVRAPNKPPFVSLERIQNIPNQQKGTKSKVFFSAKYKDASGIDTTKTKFLLNGKYYDPIFQFENNSKSIIFALMAGEGKHTATISVTDNVGLSSEASIEFEVANIPLIQDFKRYPRSVQSIGGPAFSAFIYDRGEDLSIEGINFDIDGVPVERGKLYWEPSSGYFVVDGPFDFSSGIHVAHLSATDEHQNTTRDEITFLPGESIGIIKGETSLIAIDDITLWELENHNGDGKANPGEFVRLFINLKNKGNIQLKEVEALLESEEHLIIVERAKIDYGDIESGNTIKPVQGFDIRIDENILDENSSDPLKSLFNLKLADKDNNTWDIPLEIPIFNPSIPNLSTFETPSVSYAQPEINITVPGAGENFCPPGFNYIFQGTFDPGTTGTYEITGVLVVPLAGGGVNEIPVTVDHIVGDTFFTVGIPGGLEANNIIIFMTITTGNGDTATDSVLFHSQCS